MPTAVAGSNERRVRAAGPRPQKMAESIADQLRGQIIRRELADGEYLPVEAELCAHFETSRPTMREAFRILEAEGLLSIRRGGRFGPQVRAPRADVTARSLGLLLQYRNVELKLVYDAFVDMVPKACGRLAERHTKDDVARVREQRDRCVAAVDDGAAFLHESTRFLLLVVELAGDPVQALLSELLAEVVRAHRAAMSAYFEAKPAVRAKRAAEVLESTATIIAMVEAGDTGVADFLHAALDSHVRNALQVPVRSPVQLV